MIVADKSRVNVAGRLVDRSWRSLSPGISKGRMFVSVESVTSIDSTVAPLRALLDVIDKVLPSRNAHLVVDEAHATGILCATSLSNAGPFGLLEDGTAEKVLLPFLPFAIRPQS